MKRRASPLKESPARDEEDETSDCPMEKVADENPSASQQPDYVNMEQVDYDRDTDNDDDPDEEEQPPAGNPKPKAITGSEATTDEETESDNNPGERPALPRRPAILSRSIMRLWHSIGMMSVPKSSGWTLADTAVLCFCMLAFTLECWLPLMIESGSHLAPGSRSGSGMKWKSDSSPSLLNTTGSALPSGGCRYLVLRMYTTDRWM